MRVFMHKDSIPKVSRINLNLKSEAVVQQILEWIAQGVYKPGDRLPSENNLAEQFGVSRITIRESFKMLSIMGVVSIKQGEGTFINRLDTSILLKPLFSTLIFNTTNIKEIYEARMFVEMGTATLASRYRTEQDLKELIEDIQKMDIALKTADWNYYTQVDHEFHFRIARISNNKILLNTLATFRDLIQLYLRRSIRTTEHMQISHNGHRLLYDAIAAQDEALAAKIMAEHISVCRTQLMDSIQINKENACINPGLTR